MHETVLSPTLKSFSISNPRSNVNEIVTAFVRVPGGWSLQKSTRLVLKRQLCSLVNALEFNLEEFAPFFGLS